MENLLLSLNKRVMMLDGAMGTMLFSRGFTKGCSDLLNLNNPKMVGEIHKAYYDAGSDMILTNTFSSHRIKLKKYGAENKINEINKAAISIVRKYCKGACVIGDIGPIGELMKPYGELDFEDAYNAFREQAKSLKTADAIIIETISDIRELKAAIFAVRAVFSGPLISSMTFSDGRTTLGTDVLTYATIVEPLVDIIGVNCSDGPAGMYETAKILANNTIKPLCIQPNAGMPKEINGKTIWDTDPKKFSEYAIKYAELGVNIIGGCCGTNPDYIRAASIAKKITLKKRDIKIGSRLCSHTKTYLIKPTYVIGERINPTNRNEYTNELRSSKTDYIKNQALQQTMEGALILDINVSAPKVNEKEMLLKALEAVQYSVDAAICIDSQDIEALEAALRKCAGKPLINSVNGTEKSLETIVPLAKKYGAAIVGLCLDESGIPNSFEERIKIADIIIEAATKAGISKDDIYIDPLVMTIATNPEIKDLIIKTIFEIKNKGCKTIVGISNISHGLPNRSVLNQKFYSELTKAGLDLAIMNPIDNIIHADTQLRVNIIKVKDIDKDTKEKSCSKKLHNSILYGNFESASDFADECLKHNTAENVNAILVGAMEEVGKKFSNKEFYLPNVLLSAKAMKAAFARLKQEFKAGHSFKGKILFATVENDIHDIGKNIVIALLESNDYQVIDLGVNVKLKRIIEEAKKHRPDVIALSTLLTTTMPQLKQAILELKENNLNIPIIIGGAVITPDYADDLCVSYGKDAIAAVSEITKIIQWKKSQIY
ncbi:MAG: homocysteine S-methyltransferase family protein [archaeon]